MKEFIEKLISRLEEYKYTHLIEHDSEECLHCKENDDDWCEYRSCLICAFEKSEKIVKEVTKEYYNGWISVEDRLPEEYEHVLISTKTGYVDIATRSVEYGHNAYRTYRNNIFWDDDVIAWQPLPQPCKEGSDNNA